MAIDKCSEAIAWHQEREAEMEAHIAALEERAAAEATGIEPLREQVKQQWTAAEAAAEIEEHHRLMAAVVARWDRLVACEAEFYPEYPGTCSEYQDELAAAIETLRRGGDPS